MKALTAEEAAAIDAPHVVWGVDAAGAYLGLVPKEQAAAIASGPPPTFGTWAWSGSQWLFAPTLEDTRAAAWERIKLARAGAIDAPLVTPYGTFDSDAAARTNITDAVLMLQTLASLGTPTDINFTMANNLTVTLSTAAMVTVGLLLGQKVQTAHSIARALRGQLELAATVAEIDAVAWPA